MRNIQVVELLNGEKLVAQTEKDAVGVLTLIDPFVIAPQQQGQNGQVTFAFVPWPVFRNEKQTSFQVGDHNVVVVYDPNNQITNHYERAMAQKSGLVLPPSGIAPIKAGNIIVG
jgi:hypothetical protein